MSPHEPLKQPSLFPGQASPGICAWCRQQLKGKRTDKIFCSRKCRQSAFRIRRRHQVDARSATPLRFAYADPPYPGMSSRFYQNEESFAGEVAHADLIASLVDRFDGWALSTSASTLRQVLPLCPATARVCAWVKPIGVSSKTYGAHNTWEPLIVVAGRELRPGKRDWLSAMPARGGGTLMGRKPIAFAGFLFSMLGMLPGDSLADLFPGTGIITTCWNELCNAAGVPAGVVDTSGERAAPAPWQEMNRSEYA